MIEPGRDLGHVDREYGKDKKEDGDEKVGVDGGEQKTKEDVNNGEGKGICKAGEKCEDCE